MALLFFLGVIVLSIILPWRHDRYLWNNGFCHENGLPWECFDTDSQGGRMYISGRETDCRRHVDISYPVDRKIR